MRLLVAVLLVSCAAGPYAWRESESCPSPMTEEEHASGAVRCRAMCSSYGRDVVRFDDACRCYCAPAGGYAPQQKAPWSASFEVRP